MTQVPEDEKIGEVAYNPTIANIKLTPRQEALMLQALRHIEDAPSITKKTVRWQFWFRQIWDDGAREDEARLELANLELEEAHNMIQEAKDRL